MILKVVSSLLLLGSVTAYADDTVVAVDVDDSDAIDVPDRYSYAWGDSRLRSGIGIGVVVGGGVSGFTDESMRDSLSSDAGGMWDVRLTLGTHTPLGLELSYTGTAADLEMIPGDTALVGTTVEGALRYNVLPHFAWNPYIFAGVGWQQYDVTGTEVSLARNGIDDTADLIVAPLGAGLSYRDASGLVLDIRGTLRLAEDETLVVADASGSTPDLDSWQASGSLGYEF